MSTYLWWRDNLPKPRPYPTQRFNRNSTVMNYLQKFSESDFIDLYRIDKHPSTNEEAYVGRKEGHSINCQVICDINEKFIDAVVRWPGSTHDSTIWQLSGTQNVIEAIVKREENDFKGWLLGDSGYAQREIMMVPLLDEELTPKQKRYNEAHKNAGVPWKELSVS